MPSATRLLSQYEALAGYVFLVLTAAFGLAVLIQIYLAGEAAIIEPDDWRLHVAWIHVFQWLSLPLPAAAYLARRSIGFAAFNCIPLVIIGLQYVLIHRGLEHAWAALGGLHAVCGALLVAYVAVVLQAWRQEAPRRAGQAKIPG